MKAKVSLITLGVADLERSLRFYRDGLGFATHNYKAGDDIVIFRMEGSWLAIFPREKLAEDATMPSEGSGFRAITLAHNVGSREEVDRVLNLATAAGAKLIKTASEASWGGYSGYFADPDGHLWEVA